MPILSHDGFRFSGVVWTFKLLTLLLWRPFKFKITRAGPFKNLMKIAE
jgi:hypothetical protein